MCPQSPSIIGGAPRAIQMVKRNQFVLHVGACPHLLCRADQYPYLPGAHLFEQFFLSRFGISGVNKGYFFGWYAPGNQLVPQVVIHILKRSHIKNGEHGDMPATHSRRCRQAGDFSIYIKHAPAGMLAVKTAQPVDADGLGHTGLAVYGVAHHIADAVFIIGGPQALGLPVCGDVYRLYCHRRREVPAVQGVHGAGPPWSVRPA